ncbi:MAG: TonB-dependent receptor plug domain-containing protein [Bacteroidaceae bacterium]|nr:TonB-dependent receptor plug domain-containing protein [Bacteroidaceae bacterium]
MKRVIGLLGLLALLMCQALQAQDLTGTILKDGKPQKNIRVWLKHNRGTAKTDKEGHFWLPRVIPTDTLVMSVSTKYDAQLLIGEHRDIIVNLEEDGFTVSGGLEEVTVTAPSGKRTEYTSVITLKKMQVVNHDIIMREHVKTVLDAIRRIVPGAQYIEDPISNQKFITIVRGPNSMRDHLSPPLFVIDDVPYESGVWVDDFLSMDDVAELRVDRDGSGYGVRGANGVVIIRTMKGSDR